MYKRVLGKGQEDSPAESNDDITRKWSPAQSLSPKLGINLVPANSDLNTTAWSTNFETDQSDPLLITAVALSPGSSAQYFQEYNVINPVGASQEATQNFGAIEPWNHYGIYDTQTWSAFGQPARTPSTYPVL